MADDYSTAAEIHVGLKAGHGAMKAINVQRLAVHADSMKGHCCMTLQGSSARGCMPVARLVGGWTNFIQLVNRS